ncbi:MAG TPA: lipopolysaccharide transport periplasmic protein LptA [Burkholderiales bacterium]|nr:lipopolysaccharide transport periplasmic protein LptA [Burkholderiales bacterium]
MSPRRRVLVLALAAALAGAAHAERADRDKPLNIEADRMLADDAKQTVEFDGRVVMTQGTFTLRADRITVRQDKDGFQFGVAVGNPATFREKRDGADEWIEGQAKRIEYDGRAQRVELFDQARVARDKDEVRGNYISYDQRGEVYRVQGAKDTQAQPARDERVRAVIQPKKRDEGAARRDAPLELKGAPGLDSPRQ